MLYELGKGWHVVTLTLLDHLKEGKAHVDVLLMYDQCVWAALLGGHGV